MPDDPKECKEHAKRWEVASATTNPVLKQSLVQTEALVRARVLSRSGSTFKNSQHRVQ